MLTNVGGVAFGFYYYAPQFAETPAHLWPWVPDSPFAVGLMAAVLWLDRRRPAKSRPSEASGASRARAAILHRRAAPAVASRAGAVLETLAFIGLVKVGLWTAFVLKFHADFFYAPERALLSEALYWLHLGMVAEAFLLRPSLRALPLALGWYLLNDALDYGLGIYPRIPAESLEVVRNVAVGLTLGSAAAAALIARFASGTLPFRRDRDLRGT